MDRIFWVGLSRLWKSWRNSLRMVRPETVVGWHRRGFRRYWAWKSPHRRGRPAIARRRASRSARPEGAIEAKHSRHRGADEQPADLSVEGFARSSRSHPKVMRAPVVATLGCEAPPQALQFDLNDQPERLADEIRLPRSHSTSRFR